jgi:pantoate--beta-alanine ligase
MKTVRTVAELREQLASPRQQGRRIGLVPTMGALHDGHLSLISRARDECELVVVSLFVNPAQFDDAGDLDGYPRDERRDAGLAEELGVDFLFAPAVSEVYPPNFATSVAVGGIRERLEGEHRGAGHFDGVATVVTKLLNMVSPDVAYFGQKDAQQLAVIRRLVSDLNLPVAIVAGQTVRAADGLALSSRNILLSPDDRDRAPALHRALRAVEDAIGSGERDLSAATWAGLAELAAVGIEPEYLQIVDPVTMLPASSADGELLVLVAARLGSTRLIDNIPIRVARDTRAEASTAPPPRSLTPNTEPARPEVLKR